MVCGIQLLISENNELTEFSLSMASSDFKHQSEIRFYGLIFQKIK